LKTCPPTAGAEIDVKVLAYNLYWWNLFDRNGGRGRSAGKLIARGAGSAGFDMMGFQECDDPGRVLADAEAEGLQGGDYEVVRGPHALAIVYKSSRWSLLGKGDENVGEDSKRQYFGKRGAQWLRAQDQSSGRTVFFVNHHGPLPVSSGGDCTGSATSINIMRLIAGNAHAEDAIVLLGDFNAQPSSSRIKELDARLHRVFSGTAIGGVDHIYSNCKAQASGTNLGAGGSDHDALSADFRF